MSEERTTQALPIEEINQLTKTLVDTMADGTPKEIAKGLESQFIDRSTEHLYRKVTPTDQSGSTEVYKYVKGEIESAFIITLIRLLRLTSWKPSRCTTRDGR